MPAKKTPGKFWVELEERKLTELRAKGKPAKVIADLLGRTVGSVYGKITALRVKLGKPERVRVYVELLTQPHTLETIARSLGVKTRSVGTMKTKLRKLGYDCPDATNKREGNPRSRRERARLRRTANLGDCSCARGERSGATSIVTSGGP